MIGFGGCLRLLVEPLQRLSADVASGKPFDWRAAEAALYCVRWAVRKGWVHKGKRHQGAYGCLETLNETGRAPCIVWPSFCVTPMFICLLPLQVYLGLRHRHIRRNAVRIAPGVAWPAFHRASATLHGLPGALTSATPLTWKHCSTHLHYPSTHLPGCRTVRTLAVQGAGFRGGGWSGGVGTPSQPAPDGRQRAEEHGKRGSGESVVWNGW